jgi:hypothetical protein
MQLYEDNVQDLYGNARPGVSVLVEYEGSPATIYSDNGVTPKANPLTTGAGGSFSFYAANGVYTLTAGEISETVTLFDSTELATAGGAALVGFSHDETYSAGTLGAKAQDSVSVKDAPYNAVGDGVTDDTAAIQAAVTAAAGGTLYFPPGTYLVSAATAAAAISLPVGGIRLIGAGKYASIIKTTSDCVSIAGVDCDEVEISGLGFDGGQSANLPWQRGVLLRGVVRASVSDCHFRGMGDAPIGFAKLGFGGSDAVADGTRQCDTIHVLNNIIEDCYGSVAVVTKYVGVKNAVITGNVLKNAGPTGISVESEQTGTSDFGENLVVSNNVITGCAYIGSGVAHGISISERMRRVACVGNVVHDVAGNTFANGITIDSSPEQSDSEVCTIVVSGNIVSAVTADAGRGHGIHIYTGDVDLHGLVVSNNSIRACESGITASTGSGAKTLGGIYGAAINGNVIESCTEFGIWTANVGGAGEIPVKHSTISDNVVIASSSLGISMQLQHCSLAGNVVKAAGGDGFQLQTGSSDVLVQGNTAIECGGDGIDGNGDRVTYSSNTCMNNGQVAATAYGIIHGAASNVIAIGNRCSDTQGTPTQDYGIRVPNGSTVRNNELIGNASGNVWGGIGNQNTGTYDAGLNRTA